MYVEAITEGVADRAAAAEFARRVEEALRDFESRLRRVQAQIASSSGRHVCRLRAWAERGQTVVIESCAGTRDEAVSMATDSLKRTLGRRWGQLPRRSMVRLAAGDGRGRATLQALASSADSAEADAAEADAVESVAMDEAAVGAVAVDAGPREAQKGAPRVLLALRELDAADASLHWARMLAGTLEADLEVCRMLPDVPESARSVSGQAWLEATRRVLAATRETRRWCDEALPFAELSRRVVAGAAHAVQETAALARERGADWIVVAAGREPRGAEAVALARAAGCPVLVARPPTSRSTLLVATRADADNHPVLARAAQLAEALHAPVLAFLDVGAASVPFRSHVDAVVEPWASIQADRRDAVGQQRLPEIDVLLAHGSDPVSTLLQQARREDAEILVVGVGADEPGAGDALAASVVDQAGRSVLLVPSIEGELGCRPGLAKADGVAPRAAAAPRALERSRAARRRSTASTSTSERRRWRAG